MRKADLQRRAVELIKQVSTEKLKAGVDYPNHLQDKKEWEATHELASDSEIAKSLARAETDVKSGRLKSWGDVKRNL